MKESIRFLGVYQERYLKHQKHKRQTLMSTAGIMDFHIYPEEDRAIFEQIAVNRRSQRTFSKADMDISPILKMLKTAPSSCNRHAVYTKTITERDDKDLLSGLLVGGVGWVCHAHTILLLFADLTAYKGVAEDSMPYLDAGVMVQMAYLAAEVNNIGCCYVNPNIREHNQEFFRQRFGQDLFCGALAFGKYDFKATL
jgi:nitroreductase